MSKNCIKVRAARAIREFKLRRDGSENVAQNCKFKFVNLFRHYLSLCNF